MHITSNSNAWPHYALDFEPGDVVVIFDVRRYENSTLKLAELANERGAEILLFTDQWMSPISQLATVSFSNQIAAPSAWDSNIVCMLMAEIVIAEVQERLWDTTQRAHGRAGRNVRQNTVLSGSFKALALGT